MPLQVESHLPHTDLMTLAKCSNLRQGGTPAVTTLPINNALATETGGVIMAIREVDPTRCSLGIRTIDGSRGRAAEIPGISGTTREIPGTTDEIPEVIISGTGGSGNPEEQTTGEILGDILKGFTTRTLTEVERTAEIERRTRVKHTSWTIV